MRAKKYSPAFASRFVIGLDFFLFTFLLLCSGMPDDFFLDEPPTLALLLPAGVPLVAGWEVAGASSFACVTSEGSEALGAEAETSALLCSPAPFVRGAVIKIDTSVKQGIFAFV